MQQIAKIILYFLSCALYLNYVILLIVLVSFLCIFLFSRSPNYCSNSTLTICFDHNFNLFYLKGIFESFLWIIIVLIIIILNSQFIYNYNIKILLCQQNLGGRTTLSAFFFFILEVLISLVVQKGGLCLEKASLALSVCVGGDKKQCFLYLEC